MPAKGFEFQVGLLAVGPEDRKLIPDDLQISGGDAHAYNIGHKIEIGKRGSAGYFPKRNPYALLPLKLRNGAPAGQRSASRKNPERVAAISASVSRVPSGPVTPS